jgi:hypothetical protein
MLVRVANFLNRVDIQLFVLNAVTDQQTVTQTS